jgi:hypothetical protein
MKIKILCLLLLVIFVPGKSQQLVSYDNKNISYMGRIDFRDLKSARIYWPGTSVTLNFKGTEIKAIMKNNKVQTYFFVIVDNDSSGIRKIRPDTTRKSYILATGLPLGNHTIQLIKLTDNTSVTSFYGFELSEGSSVLKPDAQKKRKMEFYGNSITVGHGIELPIGPGDSGSPQYVNNYYAYGAVTARHYNAGYSCIGKSGIGLMLSNFPVIMPEMFDRLDPSDPKSKWDFSKYRANIVVIDLFQNDQYLVQRTNNEQFKARFGTTPPDEKYIVQAYLNFLKNIRSKYPKASIICVLGSMDATKDGSVWPGYIEKAVQTLGDHNVYAHFFAYKNTPGHPRIIEQKAMADDLINFIDKNIKW